MMLGSSDPTPFDAYAMVALWAMAVVLVVGCILGPRWASHWASMVRWGVAVLSVLILAAVFMVTPTTNGMVGAGRMLTLLPAAAAVAVLFLVWCWRIGRF